MIVSERFSRSTRLEDGARFGRMAIERLRLWSEECRSCTC